MPVLRDTLDRRIVGLAIPALGTLAVEPLYVLVDTAIVGRLGTEPLAGLALAAPVLLLVTAGCNFLAYGTTQRVGRFLGGGEPGAAAGVGVQALWIAALLGVPLAVLVAALAAPAAAALGGSGPSLDAAVTYLSISAVGLPFVLVALAGMGMLRGLVDLRTPLVIVVVANVVNLVVELVLVFGLGLGIAGSAWSTVVAQAGAAAAFLVVLRPHLRLAPSRRASWNEMEPLLTAGRHLVLRVGAMLAVFVGSTAVAGRVDVPTLAAHQIVLQVFNLLALGLDALAIPAQTLVARALGGREVPAAARIGWAATRLSLIAGTVLGAVVAAASWALPWAFTADPAVASRATAALLVLAVLLLPGAVAFGLDGALIGAGDYAFLGRVAVANIAAFMPLAVATLAWPSLGIVGVWAALAAWMAARAAVNTRRFRSRSWAPRLV
jgi:putative MATE family efflux protein